MDTAVKFPTTPKGVKAAPVALSKRMSVELAFQVIAHNCLEHIRANEAGVARFFHGESLHQMRVGLRRLRAALSMVRELLALTPSLQIELDWAVDQLGAARDWDVLLDSTLPPVDQASQHSAPVAGVAAAAQQKRDELHRLAAVAVSSGRYQNLMQGLQSWTEKRGWRQLQSPEGRRALKRPVAGFAAAILENDQKRLLRRGRKLDDASAEQSHRLRIAAKKTRYATEFFASLYPRRRVRPYVEALSTLQDELGALNDAVVAGRLLEQLADGPDDLREGSGFIRGFLASGAEERGARVRRMWKKFLPVKAPH